MVAEHQSLSILLIDGNQDKALLYQKLLNKSPYLPPIEKITYLSTLEEALCLLDKETFDLVIVDLFLSDSSGLETFLLLQKVISEIPIIVLTRSGDETLAFDAIGLGAEDYLLQNEMNLYTISRAIRNALERHPFKESLKTLTYTDDLTKLYNRRGFFSLSEQQIEIAKREQRGFYLFLIDVDHLKDINDTFGHKAGDLALIGAAECIKNAFRSSDIVGRIGGDEFAVLAIGADENEDVKIKMHLRKTIQAFNREQSYPYNLSLSIGSAYFDASYNPSLSDLLEMADSKLYEEKKISHRKEL